MKKHTIDGPFSPNAHWRVYVSAPGTVAGRICLSTRSGKPLQFKDKHEARTFAENQTAA